MEIFVVRPDGSDAVNVSRYCGADLGMYSSGLTFDPSWSPDGRTAPSARRCTATLRVTRVKALGRVKVRIPGGSRRTVTAKLKQSARRILSQRGRLRVTVRATVSYRAGGGPQRESASRTRLLRAP